MTCISADIYVVLDCNYFQMFHVSEYYPGVHVERINRQSISLFNLFKFLWIHNFPLHITQQIHAQNVCSISSWDLSCIYWAHAHFWKRIDVSISYEIVNSLHAISIDTSAAVNIVLLASNISTAFFAPLYKYVYNDICAMCACIKWNAMNFIRDPLTDRCTCSTSAHSLSQTQSLLTQRCLYLTHWFFVFIYWFIYITLNITSHDPLLIYTDTHFCVFIITLHKLECNITVSVP